ncbi:nucleoside phosphorylase domain-containing protein [Aspergillus egyptiacus]|nr:nucleoside phosphorylase domain-containing protein [Aspergillus egyptiacus]
MAVTKALESPDLYTIAWISPLPIERAAATAMLDERHNRPGDFVQHPADTNSYTWGKMGDHHVVIASLPAGLYGTTSAAITASNLLSSLPQIRIGLLVGIGGGIARPEQGRDIRLGDVVVSQPSGSTGGVIQYDLGKAKSNQTWERNDSLTLPPLILRHALASLQAEHELGESRLPELLGDMPHKTARTATTSTKDNEYVHQGVENDRLFKSSYAHIHYGIIASGNTLVKDAAARDRIVEDIGEECICFEMEAAGLMSHFPCLVIRGVCDYADSHKNDRWQRYASATAAAYGKELLGYVPARDLRETQRALDLLRSLGQKINQEVRATRSELQQWKQSEESQKILSWLKDTDNGAQLSDYLNRRQDGTGTWFLNDDTFTTWLAGGQQRTLFCPGLPGSGKTIMASIVVDELYRRFQHDVDVGISFLFCNFRLRHAESPNEIMAGILKQLLLKNGRLPEAVKDLYHTNERKKTRPLYDELCAALDSTVSRYSRTFIVVDALDEGDDATDQVVSTIMDLQNRYNICLLVTSRFIPEISARFKASPWLEIRAKDDDVRKFVQKKMKQLPAFVARNSDLQRHVVDTITKAVDGMFLLAHLHLGSLSGKRSPKAIKTAISKLPSGSDAYDCAYQDAMTRIEGHVDEQALLAKQALAWIVCAKRHLRAEELQHALAVEIGESEFEPDNMPDIHDVISLCAGLVTTDRQSGVIRLVHYTTQEYFERTWDRWFPTGHQDIAMTCLTYLAFDAVRDVLADVVCPTPGETAKGLEAYMEKYCLYDYSCRNWGHHARGRSGLSLKLTQATPI